MNTCCSIEFRGQSLSLQKIVDEEGTSAHPVSAAEAWERISPYLEKTGVTRVSDITQLDRVGIPVYNVLRPSLNGYTAAHGKGFTAQAAKLSAAGESLERWFGTRDTIPSFRSTWNKLARSYPMVFPENLGLTPHSFFHKDLEIPWVLGWDIISQEEIPLPLELVKLSPGGDDRALMNFSSGLLFQASSNGLACGVYSLEAISQALLEVIERDSVTCSTMASRAAGAGYPVFRRALTDTIPFPRVRNLLDRIQAADIEVILSDNASDVHVPTWNCFLFDMRDSSGIAGVAQGMGTSLDHETAMIRAITEAVQSRCVLLSGVRDLIPSKDFECSLNNDARLTFGMLNKGGVEEMDLSGLANPKVQSFEEDVHACIRQLGKAGMDRVIVYRLTRKEDAVQVVKVFVPGAEGYIFPYYKPGQRAVASIKHTLGQGSPLYRKENFSWQS